MAERSESVRLDEFDVDFQDAMQLASIESPSRSQARLE
jgi:hypothetical protein